jgi:2-polyprenyl-3-methyl-5-hydroxy-6-metoxy-1,4-benzoquinol methylase
MSLQRSLDPGWMSNVLETLASCPVCGSNQSTILHDSVSDHLFGFPGVWKMWKCGGCNVAHLNPRLTREVIGQAYRSYYTHATAAPSSMRTKVRTYVAKAYAKRRLGAASAYHLAWSDGAVRWIFSGVAKHLPAQYRYLSRPKPGATLLDVGCGNGDFLSKVQPLGWRATGLEFDPQACAVGLRRGLDIVHGAVPGSGLREDSFDAVTMHHVIEHVHDPRAVLEEVFRLLKVGGRIVVTTPNWCSYGSNLYGRYWRGLEPPRHLVLFTPDTLLKLAVNIGFIEPEIRVFPEAAHFYFQQSYAIAEAAVAGPVDFLPDPAIEVERACLAASDDRNLAEEFTLIATKPRSLSN